MASSFSTGDALALLHSLSRCQRRANDRVFSCAGVIQASC